MLRKTTTSDGEEMEPRDVSLTLFSLHEMPVEEKRKVRKMTVNPEGGLILSEGRQRREHYELVRRPGSSLWLPMRRVYCQYSIDKSGVSVSDRQTAEHRIKYKDFT